VLLGRVEGQRRRHIRAERLAIGLGIVLRDERIEVQREMWPALLGGANAQDGGVEARVGQLFSRVAEGKDDQSPLVAAYRLS